MLLIGWWMRLLRLRKWRAPTALRYAIRRSSFGWLSIRFTGGPVYLDMLDDLKSLYKRYGHLVGNGEELSGQAWVERILTTDACLTAQELQAIKTLLPGPAGPAYARITVISSKGG